MATANDSRDGAYAALPGVKLWFVDSGGAGSLSQGSTASREGGRDGQEQGRRPAQDGDDEESVPTAVRRVRIVL